MPCSLSFPGSHGSWLWLMGATDLRWEGERRRETRELLSLPLCLAGIAAVSSVALSPTGWRLPGSNFQQETSASALRMSPFPLSLHQRGAGPSCWWLILAYFIVPSLAFQLLCHPCNQFPALKSPCFKYSGWILFLYWNLTDVETVVDTLVLLLHHIHA